MFVIGCRGFYLCFAFPWRFEGMTRFPVVGMNRFDPAAAAPLRECLPGKLAPRRTADDGHAAGIGFPDSLRAGFEKFAETFLRVTQYFPHAFEHVGGLSDQHVKEPEVAVATRLRYFAYLPSKSAYFAVPTHLRYLGFLL